MENIQQEDGSENGEDAGIVPEEEGNYESDGSYKQDSCMVPSDDDEELNHAKSEHTGTIKGFVGKRVEAPRDNSTVEIKGEKEEMGKTFQTNEEREDYCQFMNTLKEKYTNMKSMADSAREQQWDTRKELRKVAQPKPAKMNSLAGSKKSFKRNRNHDNLILNERSGDLMSNVSQNKISPQDLFKHFEN